MQAVALLLALGVQAEPKDSIWMTDYKAALQTALQTGKPLVVDAGRAG